MENITRKLTKAEFAALTTEERFQRREQQKKDARAKYSTKLLVEGKVSRAEKRKELRKAAPIEVVDRAQVRMTGTAEETKGSVNLIVDEDEEVTKPDRPKTIHTTPPDATSRDEGNVRLFDKPESSFEYRLTQAIVYGVILGLRDVGFRNG